MPSTANAATSEIEEVGRKSEADLSGLARIGRPNALRRDGGLGNSGQSFGSIWLGRRGAGQMQRRCRGSEPNEPLAL